MSVETYGAQESRIYFVAESTYGVTPASPAMLGINAEESDPLVDPALIGVMGLGSRDLQALYAGLRKITLKIPNKLSSLAPISLIQHVQTLSSLSIQTIYYKGLWSAPTNIISYLFSGCKVNKLTVECKLEDVIKSTVELLGQSCTRLTALIQNATYGDFVGAVPFNSSFVQRGVSGGTGLVTLTDITDWKFEIDNNLKPVGTIQSGGTGLILKYLRERNRKLSGELTMEFENDSEMQDFLLDTEFSLSFGLGSTNTALFTYCKWDQIETPDKMDDLISVKAKFKARNLFIS
jgi:hypothetical protein